VLPFFVRSIDATILASLAEGSLRSPILKTNNKKLRANKQQTIKKAWANKQQKATGKIKRIEKN
jgi:hypothetical protein